MLYKQTIIWLVILGAFAIGVHGSVFAASDELGVDLTADDVLNIVYGLTCWIVRMAGAVMVIFLVLAGLRFMYARGDASKWTDAKKNFNHVLIGVVVITGVYVIIATIANAVGADFSFIPLVC